MPQQQNDQNVGEGTACSQTGEKGGPRGEQERGGPVACGGEGFLELSTEQISEDKGGGTVSADLSHIYVFLMWNLDHMVGSRRNMCIKWK